MKKILLSLLLIFGLCVPSSALAAIAADATSSGNVKYYSPATSITVSHTVGAGSDRFLVVGVGDDSAATCTTATYNGTSMTKSGDIKDLAYACIFYLANPDSGTHDIVVNFSESTGAVLQAISLTGVAQQAPDDFDSNTGSGSTSITLTTAEDNSWIIDVVTNESQTITLTPGAGQTASTPDTDDSTINTLSYKTISTAGSGNVTWGDGVGYNMATVAIALSPSGGGGNCDTDCTLCEDFPTCKASASSCFYFDGSCSETAGTFKTEIK